MSHRKIDIEEYIPRQIFNKLQDTKEDSINQDENLDLNPDLNLNLDEDVERAGDGVFHIDL